MSGHGLGSTEASTSVTINAPGAAKDTTPEHTQANGAEINQSHAKPSVNGPNARGIPAFSPATTEILKRVSANSLAAATNGTPGWEAAREQVLKSMVTSDKFPTPPPPQSTGKRGGRAGKAVSPLGKGGAMEAATPETSLVPDTQTEQSTPVTGTGRGRGGGRPRGSGRGRGRGGGRGGKRKRDEDDVIKAEDDSEDSESYTPFATMTKSGRAVTKPTTFTPQVPSPASGVKRKRPMNRKNPELAVCNVCLRPHSPASNMIVFCDGCNTPYHRYCHHPPIEQEVVDVPDMEWFCAECRIDRAPSASEVDIDTFVSAQGASESQKRAYLQSLPHATLVSLLAKASSLHPDIPIFASNTKPSSSTSSMPPPAVPNGTSAPAKPTPHPQISNITVSAAAVAQLQSRPDSPQRPEDLDPSNPAYGHLDGYNDDDPPAHFPQPGHGLARTLPPEQDDLQWLVDDNYEVYSHIYQTDPGAANRGLNGGEDVAGEGGTDVGSGARVGDASAGADGAAESVEEEAVQGEPAEENGED